MRADFRVAPITLAMLPGVSVARDAHAPAVLITGSYFPSWMVFFLVGIIISVVVRVALIRFGLDDVMPFRVLAYTALALAITFALLLFNAPV